MRETQIQEKEAIEVVSQTQFKKHLNFLGSISPQRGHTLYEYNWETNSIKEAEFRKEVELNFIDDIVNKSILVSPNCTYVSALNKKNALKKLGFRKIKDGNKAK
jgi:hypothetical protein